MKKALSILTLCFLAVLQMSAQRNWTPLTNNDASVSSETVVFATLQDADGNPVRIGMDVTLGAFVGDECRAIATPETTNAGTQIFTLRIAVKEGESDQTVNFALKCTESYANYATEYTLAETIKVSESDETVNYPSKPFVIKFTPVQNIEMKSPITINKGAKVNLKDYMTITPTNANLPDAISWEYGNSAEYIKVENGVLEGLKPTQGAYLDMVPFFTPIGSTKVGGTTVIVQQPITSLSVNPSTITVNINDANALTSQLSQVLVITPEDATEEVTWTSSDPNAIEKIVSVTTSDISWNPKKVGTYTMTASCQSGFSATLTVIIRKPVTEITLDPGQITVAIGDNVSQYLPHTFTTLPADATNPMDGISYHIVQDETNNGVLGNDEEGNIIAKAVGHVFIQILHEDIEEPKLLTVEVIEPPKASDFTITNDPLVFKIPQSEINGKDITTELKANIKSNKYSWNDLTWAENANDSNPILSITAGGATASDAYLTKAYGTTRLVGTKTYKLCGFDENGTFNPQKKHDFTIGFGVSIVQSLSSISFNDIQARIGCEETHQLTITTVPENYPLDDIKFNIPAYTDETQNSTPYFTLTRDGESNTWTINPKLVGTGKLTATLEGKSAEMNVYITQRINATEGWNWISLYAGQVGGGVFEKYFQSVQEIRSQSDLVYNDPSYGFFGTLQSLDGSSCYKVNVKDGLVLDYPVENSDLYNYNSIDVTLHPGWNWFNNPYCKSHIFMEVFGKVMALPVGSRVVAQNGFMEFTGEDNLWEGTLESLNAGQGYLIYNAGETDVQFALNADRFLSEYVPTTNAKAFGAALRPDLTYNYRQFADNMTIIASLKDKAADGQYSIWAFVGDECRGEGKMIDGRFFITVGGKSKETVTFKLFDTTTGEFIPVDDAVSFTKTLGTYAKPTAFSYTVTGIRDIAENEGISIRVSGNSIIAEGAQGVQVFTTNGQQVSQTNLAAGTYIVKATTANGVISKKIVVRGR